MTDLPKKHIVLGITGGVAAYKAAELARLLIKDGCEVQVVMTQAATGFITPATLQALTGRPVFTDMWDDNVPNRMAHIELTRSADAIVIAPASADFIAKLAHGLADDLLSTLCVARPSDCSLMVAPAMNHEMWDNAATQRNVAQIALDGIALVGPTNGDQACGETGMGRMVEPEEILQALQGKLQPKALAGKRLVITAGPTFEAIDAVRGITNRSSGKMGYAIAQAALDAGATVTLISGPSALTPPAAAHMVRVESAAEMFAAVRKAIDSAQIFISVAAVSDYTIEAPSAQKLKKSERTLHLNLKPTPDILSWVTALPRPPFCVGFAAESEKLLEHAEEKRRRKKLPLLAANLASAAGADDNELVLLDDHGMHRLPRAAKTIVARQLLSHIIDMVSSPQKTKPLEAGVRGERPHRLH